MNQQSPRSFLLLFVASKALALFKSPYSPKLYPPDQTIVASGWGPRSQRRERSEEEIATSARQRCRGACTKRLFLDNGYFPVALFPALLPFPENCECKYRTDWPFCARKICEPKIQLLLAYRLRLVSPLPIVR